MTDAPVATIQKKAGIALFESIHSTSSSTLISNGGLLPTMIMRGDRKRNTRTAGIEHYGESQVSKRRKLNDGSIPITPIETDDSFSGCTFTTSDSSRNIKLPRFTGNSQNRAGNHNKKNIQSNNKNETSYTRYSNVAAVCDEKLTYPQYKDFNLAKFQRLRLKHLQRIGRIGPGIPKLKTNCRSDEEEEEEREEEESKQDGQNDDNIQK